MPDALASLSILLKVSSGGRTTERPRLRPVTRVKYSIAAFAESMPKPAGLEDNVMDTQTLLIIVILILLLGGGGWYGRGRWF